MLGQCHSWVVRTGSSTKCQPRDAETARDWLQKPLFGGIQKLRAAGDHIRCRDPHVHWHVQHQLLHPVLADLSMPVVVQQVSII